jgi:exodeoxyribonuclease V alpha subunit
MNRAPDLIDRLEAANVLNTVDAALGRLLAGRSARHGEMLGVVAALASAALAQGHSCLPLAHLHAFVDLRLADGARDGAGWSRSFASTLLPSIEHLREALDASPWVAADGDAAAALVLDRHDRVFLRRYFNYERSVANALLDRAEAVGQRNSDSNNLRAVVARYFDAATAVDEDQRIAVLLALRSRFLIVTGGPGAGKTSTVLRVLAITIEQALLTGRSTPRIALTAPTGKAAARLSETLRAPTIRVTDDVRTTLPTTAMTLHRLLGVLPGRTQPRYGAAHPLPYDLVVVDEASMLDLSLAARLCAALAPATRLILLGDRDQLASVEAGSVFGALCAAAGEANRFTPQTTQWLQSILVDDPREASAFPAEAIETNGIRFKAAPAIEPDSPLDTMPVGRGESRHCAVSGSTPLADALVELRSSHRFAEHSVIGRFARAVRAGDSDDARDLLRESSGEVNATAMPEQALNRVILEQVVPRFVQLAPPTSPQAALEQLERFRVLCALREGPFGAIALNALIEHELRRRSSRSDAQGWFAGRLVMIRSNDYAQGLFNGDIGVALPTGAQGEFEVWLRNADGMPRAIPPALLPPHEGAFALTVHKAQGSEFDEVLIVLPARDARVLTRELLYTAVTRARKKVELWTSGEILDATISRRLQRWSGLVDALRTPRI